MSCFRGFPEAPPSLGGRIDSAVMMIGDSLLAALDDTALAVVFQAHGEVSTAWRRRKNRQRPRRTVCSRDSTRHDASRSCPRCRRPRPNSPPSAYLVHFPAREQQQQQQQHVVQVPGPLLQQARSSDASLEDAAAGGLDIDLDRVCSLDRAGPVGDQDRRRGGADRTPRAPQRITGRLAASASKRLKNPW
jgi:hypothetical protein